jgi:hypothetical protein
VKKGEKKKKSGEIINKIMIWIWGSFVLDFEEGFGYHVTDTPYLRIFSMRGWV